MSLSKLKNWIFGERGAEKTGCDGECTACQHVEPGSVTLHTVHVLLRLPLDGGQSPAHSYWPEKIEDLPVVASLSSALKDSGLSGVKITLFEYVGNDGDQMLNSQAPETCDVLLFPACLRLKAVPISEINDTVVQALCGKSERPNPSHEYLIVCCHAARDARCGYLGPRLAQALSKNLSVKSQSHNTDSTVIMSSHVGGHKYAGNLIVYGKRFPGVWFGGLSAEVADEFMDHLLSLKDSVDAAEDQYLSHYWRGQTGLSKEEQLALYNRFRLENQEIENIAH